MKNKECIEKIFETFEVYIEFRARHVIFQNDPDVEKNELYYSRLATLVHKIEVSKLNVIKMVAHCYEQEKGGL